MKERGYKLSGALKHEGTEKINRVNFLKSVYPASYQLPVNITASVTNTNEECNQCWFVELTHGPLKLYMHLSSGQIPLTHKEFAKYEKALAQYAHHCVELNIEIKDNA